MSPQSHQQYSEMTSSPTDICENILRSILREICEDSYRIEEERFEGITTFMAKVSSKDMPFVIGKGGQVAEAITGLFRMLSLRLGENIGVRFIDPPTRENGQRRFQGKESWNSSNVYRLASDICEVLFTTITKVDLIDAKEPERDFYDRFTTILRIETGAREKVITEVNKLLTPLFDVIGKSNGRRIKVSIGPAEL